MKLKLALYLILTFFVNESFSQSKIEKNILGIWQITKIEIDDWYSYNYENNEVILAGFLAMASDENAKKTKSDIKASAKIVYYGFNNNYTFVYGTGENTKKGTYEIETTSTEGMYILKLKYVNTEITAIQFENTNPRQLIIVKEFENDGMEMTDVSNFKFLNSNELTSKRKNLDFNKFESELISAKKIPLKKFTMLTK